MQDFYGPGHLINDKRVACDNILKEMNSVEYYDGPDYEPTGFQGNFYRVNLRLISEGIIPYQTYLNAFVESVQSIQQPEFQYWIQIWKEIDHQISEMNWTFENEDQDRKDIYEGFREGKFIVHHSDAYNKAVNFHYRIISKDNFNKIILPLINQSKDTK
ncbi:MAG: hypothetical protein J1F12_05775 [Muribaculaceae bacterium]|nr:hypothetical protein [Muribaculaceae bacterium]